MRWAKFEMNQKLFKHYLFVALRDKRELPLKQHLTVKKNLIVAPYPFGDQTNFWIV